MLQLAKSMLRPEGYLFLAVSSRTYVLASLTDRHCVVTITMYHELAISHP